MISTATSPICRGKLLRLGIIATSLVIGLSQTASAQNLCAQDQFKADGNNQNLGCTANDVRVARVVGVRDLAGNPLTTCIQGTTFSFIADFEVVTSSTSSRSNIGLYFASQGQANALNGTCVDNIISPMHQCPGAAAGILCGSDNYHELDSSPDNCGDTSSGDTSSVFGAAAEGVTVEVTNFLCQAPAGQTGAAHLVLPNCTTWQVPGKTLQCTSVSPTYPFNANAIPGAPSKCNCGTIDLPIQPVNPSANVTKSCNTGLTTGTGQTTCDAGPEGSTVTFHVGIGNTADFGNIIVDQICDSEYGTVADDGAPVARCPAGSLSGASVASTTCVVPLTVGSTLATCDFTVAVGENITGQTDTVTVAGHSAVSTGQTFSKTSNSVTVTSSDAPSTATLTNDVVATTASCATVRYSVDVKNTSGADESIMLTALTDSAYGDLTKCTNASCANNSGASGSLQILGTTCGLASGIGTLAGNAGSGVFPASLSVGGSDYKCQFDAQFCSALDNNSCISNLDTPGGSFTGDEAADKITASANTLTVKECLQTTVNSTSTP